jgi:hypothetical protein
MGTLCAIGVKKVKLEMTDILNKRQLIIFFAFLCSLSAVGQGFKLKSVKQGFDMIYRTDISKDSVINYTRFEDGRNDKVDILRFDNIGNTGGSDLGFIISSKQPVPSDSLGMNFFKLNSDSLKSLIRLIHSLDTKIYKRVSGGISFRMTYRFEGIISQYFIGGGKESTEFFKKIEQRILLMENKEAIERLQHFLWTSDLLKKRSDGIQTYSPRGQIQWAY